MNIQFLDKYTFYVTEADYASVTNWGWQFSSDNTLGRDVRFVRGRKSRNVKSLFNEFSAALQFPYYFGENWNAFDECISDLDWLGCKFCVVVVFDAEQLLSDEEQDLNVLMRILQDARQNRTMGLQSIDDADVQKDLPFYVILQCPRESKDKLTKKLETLGAIYNDQENLS